MYMTFHLTNTSVNCQAFSARTEIRILSFDCKKREVLVQLVEVKSFQATRIRHLNAKKTRPPSWESNLELYGSVLIKLNYGLGLGHVLRSFSRPLFNNSLLSYQNNYQISQHRSLEERLEAAKIVLTKNPPCPVFVDCMENTTNIAYAALPERLYVIFGDKVSYVGRPGPDGYSLDELRRWLAEFKNNVRQRAWTR